MPDKADTKSLNAAGDSATVEGGKVHKGKNEKKKNKVDQETQTEEKDGNVKGKGKGGKKKEEKDGKEGKEKAKNTEEKEVERKGKGKDLKIKESKKDVKFTEEKEVEGKSKGKELKKKESKKDVKATEEKEVEGKSKGKELKKKESKVEGKTLEKEVEGKSKGNELKKKESKVEGKTLEKETEGKGKGKKETVKEETGKETAETKAEVKKEHKVKKDKGDQISLGYYYDEDMPHVTPDQIARQLAAIRARDRVEARSWYHQWPSVTKVPIRTKPWAPPGPRERPPRVIIQLPKLKTETWIPPWMQKKPPRPKLPRQTPEVTEPLPYETTKLNKVWHRFCRVDANKMILQGTLACDSKRYGLAIRACQTGSIALVARALLHEKTPAQLDKTDVDDVIEAADQHYKLCTKTLKCYKGNGNPDLQLKQLHRELFFRDTHYKLDYRLEEVQSGLLLKRPIDPEGRPIDRGTDLLDLMEQFVGQTYMFVLTMNKTKHFLIWGHPPEPDSGSLVETVCYIFDPFMLDEVGTTSTNHTWQCTCIEKAGAGAFLRYAGVTSFVVDFLMNHGNLLRLGQPVKGPHRDVPVTLTPVDVIDTKRVMRYPTYKEFDMVTQKHCQSEIDAVTAYAMTEEKMHERMWARASLSAESVNVSRRASRKRLRKMLGLDGIEKPPQPPIVIEPAPVPPEKPPPQPTIQELIQKHKGENFFLYCPRPDEHTFGRDDLVPLAKSEQHIHSHFELGSKTYKTQFSEVEPGKWLLRGTRHFASYRYQSFKWYTGIACCLAALAMLKRHRARAWNEDILDESFDAGYNLLRESLMERRGPIRRLVLGEHKRIFSVRDKQFKFKNRNIVVWGKLWSPSSKIFDLCRGLEIFFKEADTGILQIPGELETAIWFEGGCYYMYHPWPADEHGYKVSLQGGGKGCLIAFASIEKLCEHFLENCRDLKRKPYTISDVTVWDLGERPEPFNNMKAVGPSRWLVRGSFHEGDERFPEAHRNRQATPTAITAIAMASVVDPSEWTQADIDEVLIRGDILYEKTIENLDKLGISLDEPKIGNNEEEAKADEEEDLGASGVTGTLAAADVLPRFNITPDDAIEVEMQDSAFSGKLLAPKGSGVLSLKQSLKALFKDNTAGVVTARGASMAVWKHDDHLYFFDPHACDENGLPSDDILATACLIRMKNNVKELADVIMGNLEPGTDDSFNITPIEIIRNKINPELGAPEIQKEGKAFEWLNRNTATILMGPRGENTGLGEAARKCSVPPDDLAGRTLALPVIAAFTAATEAVPPPGMHQEHMFNFLEAGGEYYLNHVKTTGLREITVDDLSERFPMGVNTFSIEVGEPTTLPLRLPDQTGEGGGGEEEENPGVDSTLAPGEEGYEPPKEVLKEMKQLLFQMWYDTTRPTTVSLLVGDYHQLGVWMAAGGKVVAFDPAPTLAKGALTKHRIIKGDELRNQRLKEAMGEGAEEGDEPEAAGEEAQPEPEPEFVPPESCPVLMVFASPGEFIDKLVSKGGLDPKQAIAPYTLYPVTVTNELTSMLRDKKPPGSPKEDEEPAADAAEEEEQAMVEPLEDEAMGKYFERKTRTTASMRAHIAQDEPYFMDAPNRDNQDGAMAVMGIIVHHIEPYEYWKPSLVDAILKYGDRLYTLSLPNAKHPPRVAPAELIQDFHVTNFKVKTEVKGDVVTGDYKAGDTGGALGLRKGLKKFFESETFGVICAKNYCAGVWRAKDNKAWVYWDTHPVGPTGKLSPASAAGIVLFSTLDELAETFKTNLHNLCRPGTNNYSISSVKVTWEFTEAPQPVSLEGTVADAGYEWKVLTAYVQIGSGRTMLRGTPALDYEKFARDAQLWSSASAIIAACMANIRRPQTWTMKTVDDIIRNGCSLFNKSMQKLGYEFCPGEDALHPLQVEKSLVLGTNFIRYDLQELTHGRLEGRTYQEMTAELGLEKFFSHHTFGVLWSVPHAVALWRVKGPPQFYMMEPHACGPTGLRINLEDDVAACVMTFSSPKQMAMAYLQNLPRIERRRTSFELYVMTLNVAPLKPLGAGDSDPPLVRPPPGAPKGHKVVPATLRVGPDGMRRDLVAGGAKRSETEIRDTRDMAMVSEWNRANAEDMDQGLRNTNGWLCLKDCSQYLSAYHSMNCKRFPYASRGNQALACSVMAVAASAVNEICYWCMKSLTEILISGNQLYQDSFLHYKPKDTTILNMTQILRKFYTPRNCACRVTVFKPRQHGSLNDDGDQLAESIRQFFREENKGVFVAHGGEFAVALFKNSRGFYMFDAGDRDRYGRALPTHMTGHGRACFSQYPTVRALAEKLKANIPYREEKNPLPPPEPEVVKVIDIPISPDEKGKDSKVHFGETTARPPETDKDSINGPGKFSIYGIHVTSLRNLLPFEK